MLRKLTYTVVVAGISVGFALAQAPATQPGTGTNTAKPMWGKITKYNQNQVYFQPYDPATQKFGDIKTYPVTADQELKILQMQNNQFVPVTGGLNSNTFQKIPEGGLYGSVMLKGNNLNTIQLYGNQNAWMQGMKAGAGGTGGTGGTGGGAGGTGGGK